MHSSSVDYEKILEQWIEATPDLLEIGLRIVGRQVHTVAGKVDLVGRDPQGRWVIVEIKRGQATRDALAQAIDYAAAIAELSTDALNGLLSAYSPPQAGSETLATQQEDSPDERQIRIILVGIGKDPGLSRIVTFLSTRFQLPITTVAFSVYQVEGAGHVLVRELADSEGAAIAKPAAPTPSLEEHLQEATSNGIGPSFQRILDSAVKLGLRPKSFKRSVMLAPPANGNRSLFTMWDRPEEPLRLTLWLGPETFETFFAIPQERVTQLLGPAEWRRLSDSEAEQFALGLETLMAGIIDAAD